MKRSQEREYFFDVLYVLQGREYVNNHFRCNDYKSALDYFKIRY